MDPRGLVGATPGVWILDFGSSRDLISHRQAGRQSPVRPSRVVAAAAGFRPVHTYFRTNVITYDSVVLLGTPYVALVSAPGAPKIK